jgi:hypothetical protein
MTSLLIAALLASAATATEPTSSSPAISCPKYINTTQSVDNTTTGWVAISRDKKNYITGASVIYLDQDKKEFSMVPVANKKGALEWAFDKPTKIVIQCEFQRTTVVIRKHAVVTKCVYQKPKANHLLPFFECRL